MNAHAVKYRRNNTWRVLSERIPVSVGGRYEWPTKAEADQAASQYIADHTFPCPSCGRNVIEHAVGMSYIAGKPALQCPCGTWVTK